MSTSEHRYRPSVPEVEAEYGRGVNGYDRTPQGGYNQRYNDYDQPQKSVGQHGPGFAQPAGLNQGHRAQGYGERDTQGYGQDQSYSRGDRQGYNGVGRREMQGYDTAEPGYKRGGQGYTIRDDYGNVESDNGPHDRSYDEPSEREPPRVYGRRYDPNLNPSARSSQGDDDEYQQSYPSYSNNAYQYDDDSETKPRVYGRKNDPRRIGDDPTEERQRPYGRENHPYDNRSKDYDEDDGGFAGPGEYHYNRSPGHLSPNGVHNEQNDSFQGRMPRSPGMDDLALEAGNPPPLPPRTVGTVASSTAPVRNQPSGKWVPPPWLQTPAHVLGIGQILLGILIFILGCVDVTLGGPHAVTAGQGIWGGLIIACAGGLTVSVVMKKKKIYIHLAIGITVAGMVADIFIFGFCGKSISNNMADVYMKRNVAWRTSSIRYLAMPYYDRYYAVYSVLITLGFIHFITGIVALFFLAIARLPLQELTEFTDEYLNNDSTTWVYPKLLLRPAKITSFLQLGLGILIFIFGCVVASFYGSFPAPPGFTTGEGIWGGMILIGCGILTILAAKFQTKFFVILVIAVASLTVIVDIILFGICGFIVDELNRPSVFQTTYLDIFPQPDLTVFVAIYDILIVLAFVHIIVALVVIVAHVLVFVPSRFFPQQKKAPARPQARIVSQDSQTHDRGVPVGQVRTSTDGFRPRNLEVIDSRDVKMMDVPPYEYAPPRYDELPPSPDPYDTAAGYSLTFAPASPSTGPKHGEYNASGGRVNDAYVQEPRQHYGARGPRANEGVRLHEDRGARPYSESEYSPRNDNHHYQQAASPRLASNTQIPRGEYLAESRSPGYARPVYNGQNEHRPGKPSSTSQYPSEYGQYGDRSPQVNLEHQHENQNYSKPKVGQNDRSHGQYGVNLGRPTNDYGRSQNSPRQVDDGYGEYDDDRSRSYGPGYNRGYNNV